MSSDARPAATAFRKRFLAGDLVLGTFVKTPTSHANEILGSIGFDFVVIDQEHAPFDRSTTDLAILGARAGGTAPLVRVAEPSAANILAVLDDGASGVLVPHVYSPEKAREIVSYARYRGGKRGFANTNRGGDYGGVPVWTHVDQQDSRVAVIAMIEDVEALSCLDGIMATPGLDGVFIGRGDLTVALGAPNADAPAVADAAKAIATAERKAGKTVCVMVANAEEAKKFQALGATAFIVSSDQGLMRIAGMKVRADFDALKA